MTLPEGVEFTITDRDFTIATIAPPTVMQSEETITEGDETEDGTEPDAGGSANQREE